MVKHAVVTFEAIRAEPKDLANQTWDDNNTALRHHRDSNEIPRGSPSVPYVDLFPENSIEIPLLVKGLPGWSTLKYGWSPMTRPWSWRKMLNGMNDATLRQILGPDGITNIVVMPVMGSYDHRRGNAARAGACDEFPPDAPVVL